METLSNEAYKTVINEIATNPDSAHAFQAKELIIKWLYEYEHGLLSISQEHLKGMKEVL